MKWRNQERYRFQIGPRGIKGKKNGIIFSINSYTKGWDKTHLGWYVLVDNTKTDKTTSSFQLTGTWFKDLEEAKEWCENYKEEK